MEQVKEDRFIFKTEWFDKQADLIREYNLTFYPRDNSIDMVSRDLHDFLPIFALLIVRHEKQKSFLEENGLPQHPLGSTLHRRHRNCQC